LPEISISDETYKKLKAFIKVIDAVLEEKLSDKVDDYAEFILSVGMEKMLQDPLPKEEMLLKTMVAMFDKNPEFVSDFVAETLKRGAETRREKEIEEIKESWTRYIA